jgi:nucleotide-binding universal stress UspA family protein
MKIIIPTDFSKNAFHALAFVYTNFKPEDLDVTLVHCIEPSSTTIGEMLKEDEILKNNADRAMDRLLEDINTKYKKVPKSVVREGLLVEWIKYLVKEKMLDLIVMGTKGENNIYSRLMGSVTESVIRTATTPVLAIPADRESKPVKHITISTAHNELMEIKFLERLVNSIKMEHGRFEVLRILTSDNQKVPKSIRFGIGEAPVQAIRNDNVLEGINEYLSANSVDILGVYHSHNSKLDYLFNESITKTICANVEVPMLVMRG